jgi:hypothetical protein
MPRVGFGAMFDVDIHLADFQNVEVTFLGSYPTAGVMSLPKTLGNGLGLVRLKGNRRYLDVFSSGHVAGRHVIETGVARFLLVQNTKTRKNIPNNHNKIPNGQKYTTWP